MQIPAHPSAFDDSPLIKELVAIGTGEKPWPSTQAKRHHYVPRLLLRGFTQDSENVRLFQLDVRSGKPQRTTVEAAASKRRYYRFVDDEGGPTDVVEAYLALVESHAAPALKRLAALEWSAADRATIAFFLSLLDVRTPVARTESARLAEDLALLELAGDAAEPESFAAAYADQLCGKSETEREELRQELLGVLEEGALKLGNADAIGMSVSLAAALDLAVAIFMSEWTVLVSESPALVTSDVGLSMFDPAPRFPWSGNAWHSSPMSETIVPLDARTAMRVRPGPAVTHRQGIDDDEADAINARTYGWAAAYIYGSNQATVQRVRHDAKKRPQLVVRPRPALQVILVDAEPGDTTLAAAHRKRGWPPYLGVRTEDGVLEPHDYMVVGPSGDAVEVGVHTTRLAKRRALRPDDPLEGMR